MLYMRTNGYMLYIITYSSHVIHENMKAWGRKKQSIVVLVHTGVHGQVQVFLTAWNALFGAPNVMGRCDSTHKAITSGRSPG